MKTGIWIIFWSVIVLFFALWSMIANFTWYYMAVFLVGLWGIYLGYARIKKARSIKQQGKGVK